MHSRRQLATIADCSARRKPLEYTPAHEQIFGARRPRGGMLRL